MKKRLTILIPAVAAVLALLCVVLFFAMPTQGAADVYAQQRATEIWNKVATENSYATSIKFGNGTITPGTTHNLKDLYAPCTGGTAKLENGVLTITNFGWDGGTWPTMIPNGAVKIVCNGGGPRLMIEDDPAVSKYSPILITSDQGTVVRSERLHTQDGDIVIYGNVGFNMYVNYGAGAVVDATHKNGLAIKGEGCKKKGYDIIIGGQKDTSFSGYATAQLGIVDNQSGSIVFCGTATSTVTNYFNDFFKLDGSNAPTAVRIASTASSDAQILFKNDGAVNITTKRGNALRTNFDNSPTATEKNSSFTYNSATYTQTYNEYSSSNDAILFEGTGQVKLKTEEDFVYNWVQGVGVIYTNQGNVRVRNNAKVVVNEKLTHYAVAPDDAGGCGVGININNQADNIHVGLYVEDTATLVVYAEGATSTAKDTELATTFAAVEKDATYATSVLNSNEERLAGTWVNYGRIVVSDTANYTTYAYRTGGSTDQCSGAVIKVGAFFQSGTPNVRIVSDRADTKANGTGLEMQTGNTINATLTDSTGATVKIPVDEGKLPSRTEKVKDIAGFNMSGGQCEIYGQGWGLGVNHYQTYFGSNLKVSGGVLVAKGGTNIVTGGSTTLNTTINFTNAFHCNAIGTANLGTVSASENTRTNDNGMIYIGETNNGYIPNTGLSLATSAKEYILASADGKTLKFPANATATNVYNISTVDCPIMGAYGKTHASSSVAKMTFVTNPYTSYVLIRENNGTQYMLGGADGGTYTYTAKNSAKGTITYKPVSGGNDTLTINGISGVQEIAAPTGHLAVTATGTNTLSNPSDYGINVTYNGGNLSLSGGGTLNITAVSNLLYTKSGSLTVDNVKLNLNGQSQLLFVQGKTASCAMTVKNSTLNLEQTGVGTFGIVHHGGGAVNFTDNVITANMNEGGATGQPSTLMQIGHLSDLVGTDYSTYTTPVTFHNTKLTVTHSNLINAGKPSNNLIQCNSGNLTFSGTTDINSPSQILHARGANPTVIIQDSAKITSVGAKPDAMAIFATKNSGTITMTITDDVVLTITDNGSCPIRVSGDHPDGNGPTAATIDFTMNDNAKLIASGRGQMLYLKSTGGTVLADIAGKANLDLNNTGLGGVTTTELFSAFMIIGGKGKDGVGNVTIRENAVVKCICDDKEKLGTKTVAGIEIEDLGDASTKGTFNVLDNAQIEIDAATAFIYERNVQMNFESGSVNARSNATTGRVLHSISNVGVKIGANMKFVGTGKDGMYQAQTDFNSSPHQLTIVPGASVYIYGTTRAHWPYAAANVSDTGVAYKDSCAPSSQGKFIITANMDLPTLVTVYTFDGGKYILSFEEGKQCYPTTANTDTAEVCVIAPGQVIFRDINKTTTPGSTKAVKGVSIDGSDATITLIGTSRIWDQWNTGSPQNQSANYTAGGSPWLLTVVGAAELGHGYDITITASQEEANKGGGKLFLKGNDWVITTRGDLIVEGYAELNIEPKACTDHTGNAIHGARQKDEINFIFRDHATVNVGEINTSLNGMTGNPADGRGIYMAGGTQRLQVLENSEFNLYTVNAAIYMRSDRAHYKELKGLGITPELRVEIGGNSVINARSSANSVIAYEDFTSDPDNAVETERTHRVTDPVNFILRLYGNATLRSESTGGTGHEVVFYHHAMGLNEVEISEKSALNLVRKRTVANSSICLIQYNTDTVNDNVFEIKGSATVSVSGENVANGIDLNHKGKGKNILTIQGSEGDKPTVDVTAWSGTGILLQAASTEFSGNFMAVDNATVTSTAVNYPVYLYTNSASGNGTRTNDLTIRDATVILNQTDTSTAANDEVGVFLVGSANTMTVEGSSNLTINHNHAGIKMNSYGDNGNQLDIKDGATVTAKAYSVADAYTWNIVLNATQNGSNTMNVLKTDAGTPTLILRDTLNQAIYLVHNSESTDQSNYLTISGAVVDIDTSTSLADNPATTGVDQGATGIFLNKYDVLGNNILNIQNGAQVDIDAAMWGIVCYQRHPTSAETLNSNKTYNNVTMQDSTVNLNVGMTGLNLDIISTGGNTVLVDNTALNINRTRENNQIAASSGDYRRGVRMIDRNAGSNNLLTVQNGSNLTIGSGFEVGVDLRKLMAGTNAFTLTEAVATVNSDGTGITLGGGEDVPTENKFIVHGDSASDNPTSLTASAKKNVVQLQLKPKTENTKNVVTVDGDAAITLQPMLRPPIRIPTAASTSRDIPTTWIC